MAKSPTAAQINKVLRFRPEWIKDPVPTFRKFLDRASLKQVKSAKAAFTKEIKAIVKSRKK
jgi:hypothetical protein